MRDRTRRGRLSPWRRWLGRRFPGAYAIHPFTLRFLDPGLERSFSRGYDIDPVFLSRLALASGLVLYALFGVTDHLLFPEHYQTLWAIRFGFGVPVLVLALLVTLLSNSRRFLDWILLAVMQLISLSLIIMMIITEGEQDVIYLNGLLLLLVYNFVAFRMRVWVATLSGGAVLLMFLAGSLVGDYGGEPGFMITAMFFLVFTALPLLFGATVSELYSRRHFVQSHYLDDLANTDSLTGLPNRRAFMQRLREEMARHDRYDSPFTLVMIDADHFKRINDEWGHDAGDGVLREMARRFRASLRDSDMVARLGGEEFGAILTQTSREEAARSCERIRRAIVETPFQVSEQDHIPLSVSMGVASPGRGMHGLDHLLKAADGAMYQAKQAGRDCIRFGE